MKNFVFQYVLFFNPDTEDSDEIPAIIDEGLIIASDVERAKIMVARKIGPQWDDFINDIEVMVRPFMEYRWFTPTSTSWITTSTSGTSQPNNYTWSGTSAATLLNSHVEDSTI